MRGMFSVPISYAQNRAVLQKNFKIRIASLFKEKSGTEIFLFRFVKPLFFGRREMNTKERTKTESFLGAQR